MIKVMTSCLPRVITGGAGMRGVSQSCVTQDAIPRGRAPREREEQSKAGDGVYSGMTEVRICPFTHQ
jgi:hypothetical protein